MEQLDHLSRARHQSDATEIYSSTCAKAANTDAILGCLLPSQYPSENTLRSGAYVRLCSCVTAPLKYGQFPIEKMRLRSVYRVLVRLFLAAL